MKKIIASLLFISAVITGTRASAQAPQDLSFLTNRATLASWALKKVDEIEVFASSSAAGSPQYGLPYLPKRIPYSGAPALSAMAKSLKGLEFKLETPIPDSIATVTVSLKYRLPNGYSQYLFSGGVSGKPVYLTNAWYLPPDASEPTMYLSGSIFIPAPGVLRAWVVETNQYGWSYKKSLQVWDQEGFWFEDTLAGEAFLCLEYRKEASEDTVQWVYDLHTTGRRAPLPSVIAKITIRDSEDVRDFNLGGVENPVTVSHYVYTYKPYNSTLTYGKVPLLVVNYTTNTWAQISVTSSVGYAHRFSVTRISPRVGVPEESFILEIPENGPLYYPHFFQPGLYHIVPLGIPVTPDWWNINEVDGWGYAGGKG